MARRKKDASDGGLGLIFVLGAVAFSTIVAVITFLFQFAVTTAFYAMPLAAGVALFIFRGVDGRSPALPESDDFDDRAASRTVAKLLGQQQH